MYLTARLLKNVQGVNSFQYSTQVKLRQGNATSIYFQLADAEQVDESGNPLRYMPDTGATISLTFSSIVSTYTVTKTAVQPYSQDPSIWRVNINSTDNIAQGNFVFTLTEGTTVRTGSVASGIVVESSNPSYC